MAIVIQLRRDPAALWATNNPLLAEGELGIELDTGRFKIGDGYRNWADLPYASGDRGEVGPQGPMPTINAVPPLNYDPNSGVLSITPTTRIEYRTVLAEEAQAGQIELNYPVTNSESVALDIRGADAAPFPGDDFEVSGQALVWAGRSLHGLIEPGDKLRVIYF